LSMAFGCLWQSCLFRPSQTSFRRQFALRLSAVVFVVQTASIALLIATPQAVLLSATGTLWPSPFSRALVPLAAIITINTSICYGLLSRTFTSVADIYESQKWGLSKAAPLMILYLIVVTLYESFRFVFI